MTSIATYLNESIQELRLVRWPTRQQAVRFSAVVIAFTAVSAVFFGGVDFVLTRVLGFLLDKAVGV
jgi:preprotein translocase subunit SecE